MTVGHNTYDVKLGGTKFTIDAGSYHELGPAARVLDRQMYQTATGELDFGMSWPYHQRSWLLGEQQYFTHEYDEMKTTAIRRYQEGHGIDVSVEGQVGLLKAISRSLALTTNPTTCPMIVSKDGASVYAFPAGETKMYKYTSGAWDSGETITSVTAPVLDAYMGGDGVIYIIDSNASGSRVMKRTTGGTWSRVTPTTTTINDGTTFNGSESTLTVPANWVALSRIPVTYSGTVATVYIRLSGAGATGTQVCKAVIYSDVEHRPSALLGTSAEVSVTSGQAEGYVAFTFSSAVSVTAGYVWIGLLAGTTANNIRLLRRESVGQDFTEMADTYADGAAATFGVGTYDSVQMCAYAVVTYVVGGWATTAYDDAAAVVWINGELYVITAGEVYCHTLDTIASSWCGGTMACTHDGALYWSDGSNKVYEYNGVGAREVVGQLPPGFTIQHLFSAHGRMWICGKLQEGDAAVYWFGQGQYGILAYFPAAAGSTRNIYAGAATNEYVLFADSRYGGSIRHYVPEGGWNHYLAYGSAVTIPYKGMVTGAGKTFIALATGAAGTQGIYCEGTTYVASATLISSQSDLQMPAHIKRWNEIALTFLPLRAGESIQVEVSSDGGRNWVSKGTVSTLSATSVSYALDYTTATLQYRLTLTAGTSQATDPRLLSVTVRGLPYITAGRQFKFRIKGAPTGQSAGRLIAAANTDIQTLITSLNASAIQDFEDPWENSYRVSVHYDRTLAYQADQPGAILDVELFEQAV